MTTAQESIKAIREALADGPTTWDYDSNQTPFYNDAEGYSRGGDCDGTYCLFGPDFTIGDEIYEGPVLAERCQRKDARYIAACSPKNIAALLARLDAVERDAMRYQKLKSVINPEAFCAYMNWHPDSLNQGLDATIDAALAQGEKP